MIRPAVSSTKPEPVARRYRCPGPDHHRAGQHVACHRDGVDLPRPVGGPGWRDVRSAAGGRLDRGRGSGRSDGSGRAGRSGRVRRAASGPTGPGVAVQAASRAPPKPAAPPTTRASRTAAISSAAPRRSRSGSRRRRRARDRQRLEWLDAGGRRVVGGGWGSVVERGPKYERPEVAADLPRRSPRPVGRAAGRSSSAIGRPVPVVAAEELARTENPVPPRQDALHGSSAAGSPHGAKHCTASASSSGEPLLTTVSTVSPDCQLAVLALPQRTKAPMSGVPVAARRARRPARRAARTPRPPTGRRCTPGGVPSDRRPGRCAAGPAGDRRGSVGRRPALGGEIGGLGQRQRRGGPRHSGLAAGGSGSGTSPKARLRKPTALCSRAAVVVGLLPQQQTGAVVHPPAGRRRSRPPRRRLGPRSPWPGAPGHLRTEPPDQGVVLGQQGDQGAFGQSGGRGGRGRSASSPAGPRGRGPPAASPDRATLTRSHGRRDLLVAPYGLVALRPGEADPARAAAAAVQPAREPARAES